MVNNIVLFAAGGTIPPDVQHVGVHDATPQQAVRQLRQKLRRVIIADRQAWWLFGAVVQDTQRCVGSAGLRELCVNHHRTDPNWRKVERPVRQAPGSGTPARRSAGRC